MDVAVGIDVGFSATKRSTGLVIIDRRTKTLADGTAIVVDTAHHSIDRLARELDRLSPSRATFCVDGPFAPAKGNLFGDYVRRGDDQGGQKQLRLLRGLKKAP